MAERQTFWDYVNDHWGHYKKIKKSDDAVLLYSDGLYGYVDKDFEFFCMFAESMILWLMSYETEFSRECADFLRKGDYE